MTEKQRRRALQLVPPIVSALLFGLTLWHFDGYDQFRDAALGPVLLAVAISLVFNLFVSAFHFHQVVRACGESARLWNITRLWIGALPLATFVPFSLGHLALVAGLRAQREVSVMDAAQLVLIDKLYSLAGLACVVGVAQLTLRTNDPVQEVALLGLALLGPAALLFEGPLRRLAGHIPGLAPAVDMLGPCFPAATRAWLLFLGILRQCTETLVFFLALHALHFDVNRVQAAAAYPPIQFLAALPASISGFGVRENLVAVFIQGLCREQGVALGLFVDGIEYVLPAAVGLIGLPYLLRLLAKRDRTSTIA